MEWYFLFIFPLAILSVIYAFFKWSLSFWERRGIPNLPASIPYGNAKGVGTTLHAKDIIDDAYRAFKGVSPIAGVYFAISPVAVVTDLDLAKTILIKDFNNFVNRPVYYNEEVDPLSAHMFALRDEKWRSIRSKLTPTFTSGKMKFMFPIVVDVADTFVKNLRKVVMTGAERTTKTTTEGTVLEMKDWLARYTTDVIGRCAFGIECNSLDDPDVEFRTMGRKSFQEPRHSQMIESLIWLNPKLCRALGVKLVRDDVSEFFMGIVRSTIAYREENNIHRQDFMDLLIELKNSGGQLTMEEIAAEAFVFFLAGFETSSSTLANALYELALNEEIQEKARCEINEVLQKYGGEVTYEAIMEMPYVDQIVTETLRLYPPIMAMFRQTAEKYHVPNTNIVIDKGISVFVPAYSIHRDPDYYPDPELFDPDRFTPEMIKTRHPMTFLGFGDGPRNCIGLRFGRIQTRVGLISVLKNFRIERSSRTNVPLKFNNKTGILASEGGLHLKLSSI